MFLKSGDKTALIHGSNRFTYKQVIECANCFNSKIDPTSGQFAIILSENRPGWIFSFYAVWKRGMIPVPVDFMMPYDDFKYVVLDCKPTVIFCSQAKYDMATKVKNETNANIQILIIDTLETENSVPYGSEYNFEPKKEDTAVIIYTSGTTGSPKGVMLSFQNLLVNIEAVSIEVPIFNPKSVVLMLLPLHHIFPLLGTMLMPFYANSTVALSPTMNSEDILATLQQNKVTVIIGVPRLYAAFRKGIMDKINASGIAKMLFNLCRKVDSYSFSRKVFKTIHQRFGGHVKHMVAGGAALDVEVGRDFKTLGFEILEGYGMTEAAPMISFTRPGRVRVGSPGELLSKTKVEIRDNEIVASGPNIMQGYLGRPQETADVLKEGWLYTGDLGYIDKNGFLFVTGRKKEIIVLSNGKNINPIEIEQKLLAMSPLIKDIGIYQNNDRLQAIIQPDYAWASQNQITDIDKYLKWEIISNYNKTVVPYKMVLQFDVTQNELPRTRLGKIQRFLLPQFAQDNARSVAPEIKVDLAEYRIIEKYIADEKKIKIHPNDHLEMDLGLDSLDKVGLQLFINNTFGLTLTIPQMVAFGSVKALAEAVAKDKTQTSIDKVNWKAILQQKIELKLPRVWVTGNLLIKSFKLFFSLYFKFKGKGIENIPAEPCIIVSNHQSFFDGLFVASLLTSKQFRKTFFYAKEKHVNRPILRFLASRNNIIAMDVDSNLMESIQKMAEVLRHNKNIIIFPEGTRTRDGKLGDFKKTFAILSRELNVPIVPVAINGAYQALPSGRHFPIPCSQIDVEFLPPIYPQINSSYDQLTEIAYKQIADKMHV